jgi:hypothetical protein
MQGLNLCMADSVLKSHGLDLVKLKPAHIFPFLKNLSDENVREFSDLYESDPLECLLECLKDKDEMVYAVVKGDEPLAITGISNEAQMWALFSKNMRQNWIRFARASPDLIGYYHLFHDQISCDVWTESNMILQWLAYLEFEPIFLSKDSEILHFVRCKSDDNNVDSLISRPVMH